MCSYGSFFGLVGSDGGLSVCTFLITLNAILQKSSAVYCYLLFCIVKGLLLKDYFRKSVTLFCTENKSSNNLFSVYICVNQCPNLCCNEISNKPFIIIIILAPLEILMWASVAQVLSKGHLLGPAGVEVLLTQAGTEEKLQSVVTQSGGK